MKSLLLISILFLTACASRPSTTSNTASATPSLDRPVRSDTLRTDEQLKEYRFGRYVDPRDPLVMHEAHPTYRVESTAHWDLRPQREEMIPSRKALPGPNASTNDAVVAEINKQRAATRTFTEQAASLNQKLADLSQAIGKTEEIAKQNLSLKKDVADLRDHLDALDAQLNHTKPASSAQPSPEDKW